MATSTNGTAPIPWMYDITREDAGWIMTSCFMIFTMQTGFGMLESGCVSLKNEANIMMKNVVDISLGGLTYWLFGYALQFGRSPWNNGFIALGDFCIDPAITDPLYGSIYTAFIFQLSFATTATTIVSGAMAERCEFKAYCLFSVVNTIVYCIPAGWVWGEHGFLKKMGVVDIAGSGPVHLIGGTSAFASALMLGPRIGRYDKGIAPLPLGNPVNAMMGLFVLWWGWLAFNSGSTYGSLCGPEQFAVTESLLHNANPFNFLYWMLKFVVTASSVPTALKWSGDKWKYAARAAVMTMISSFGGGCTSVAYSLFRFRGKLDCLDVINGVLGSLVAITAGCFLYNAWESLLIGAIGAMLACLAMPIFDKFGVDDPVGASAVHGVCGFWGKSDPRETTLRYITASKGVLAVGLFAEDPIPLGTTNGLTGLFRGGGWHLLGVQALACLCLATWSITVSIILLWSINKIMAIRMEVHAELLGADLVEHFIKHDRVGVSRAMSVFQASLDLSDLEQLEYIGSNPAHENYLDVLKRMTRYKKTRLSRAMKESTKNQNFGLNVAKRLFPKKKKKVKTEPGAVNSANLRNNIINNASSNSNKDKDLQIAWIE